VKVYIPTIGRVDRQVTLAALPERWKERTWLIQQNSESHTHQYFSCPVTRIAQVRQWVVEETEGEKLLMLDDDLQFFTRTIEDPRLRRATPEEVGIALDMLDSWLDERAMVGFGPVFMNQQYRVPYIECARVAHSFGFQRSVLRSEGIRFTDVVFSEDFHVTLSLLERGYANRISTLNVVKQVKEGASGGISTYATTEIREEAKQQFAALHPKTVTLYHRDVPDQFGMTLSCRIAWKRAFGVER